MAFERRTYPSARFGRPHLQRVLLYRCNKASIIGRKSYVGIAAGLKPFQLRSNGISPVNTPGLKYTVAADIRDPRGVG